MHQHMACAMDASFVEHGICIFMAPPASGQMRRRLAGCSGSGSGCVQILKTEEPPSTRISASVLTSRSSPSSMMLMAASPSRVTSRAAAAEHADGHISRRQGEGEEVRVQPVSARFVPRLQSCTVFSAGPMEAENWTSQYAGSVTPFLGTWYRKRYTSNCRADEDEVDASSGAPST